ncbi:hypothetical protein NPIL_58731 [Nephila pilipes]|uniref:Uncharacterized protein n=1 Tax=Nephila pilipes TaxID=299642 RepID=A0A8X6PMP1_NEPPI|nr:hypothetical protein NPIL_58731 [Nephila pilipes]
MDFTLDTEVPLPDDLAVIHSFSSPELSDTEKPSEILNLENLLNVVNETVDTSEKDTFAVTNEELNLPSSITPYIASLKENFFVELHNFESINSLSSDETENDVTLPRNYLFKNNEENFQSESININTINKVSTSDFQALRIDENSKFQFESAPSMKMSYYKKKSISEENICSASDKMFINMSNESELKERKLIRFKDTCKLDMQNALVEKSLKGNEMEKNEVMNLIQITESEDREMHQDLNIHRKESAIISITNCPILSSFSKSSTFNEKNKGEIVESNDKLIMNTNDFLANNERKPALQLDEIEDGLETNEEERQGIKNYTASADSMLSNSQDQIMNLITGSPSSTYQVQSENLNKCENYLKNVNIMKESNPSLMIKPCKVVLKKLESHVLKRSFIHQRSLLNESKYCSLSKNVNSNSDYKCIPGIKLNRIKKRNMKKDKHKSNEKIIKKRKKALKLQKHSSERDTSLYSQQKESINLKSLSIIKPCRIMLKRLDYHIFKRYLQDSNSSYQALLSETNTFSSSHKNTKQSSVGHKTFCQKKLRNLKTKPQKKLCIKLKKRCKENEVLARFEEKSKIKSFKRKKKITRSKKELLLERNEEVNCKKREELFAFGNDEEVSNQFENPVRRTEFVEKLNLESNDKQNSSKTKEKVDDRDVLYEEIKESPNFSDYNKVLQSNEFEEYNNEAKVMREQESNSGESYPKIITEGNKIDKINMVEGNNPQCKVDYDDCGENSDSNEWYEIVSDVDENEDSEEQNDIYAEDNQVEEIDIGKESDEIQTSNVSYSVTYELNDKKTNQRGETASLPMMNNYSSEELEESLKNTISVERTKIQMYNVDLNESARAYENDSNRSSENEIERQILTSYKLSTENFKESEIGVLLNDITENIVKKLSIEGNERKEIEENNTENIDLSVIWLPDRSGKCKYAFESKSDCLRNSNQTLELNSTLKIKPCSIVLKKIESQNLKNMQNLINLHGSLYQKSPLSNSQHSSINEDIISSIDSDEDIPISKLSENLRAEFKKNKLRKCSSIRKKKWVLSNTKSAILQKSKFTTGPEENILCVKMNDEWKHDFNSNEDCINQSFEDEHIREILDNRLKGLEKDEKLKYLSDGIENKDDFSSSVSVNCSESAKNNQSKFVLNNLGSLLSTKQCSVLLDRLDSEIVKIYTMNQNFLLYQKSQSSRSSYSSVGKFRNSKVLSKNFSSAKFDKKHIRKNYLDKRKLIKKQNSLSDRKIQSTKFEKVTRKFNLRKRRNHEHIEKENSKLIDRYKKVLREQRKRRQRKREKVKMHQTVNGLEKSWKTHDRRTNNIDITNFMVNGSRKSTDRNYVKKLKSLFSLKRCRVVVQRCDSPSFRKNLNETFNESHQRLQIDINMFDSIDSEDSITFDSNFNDVSNSNFTYASCSKHCEISDSECTDLCDALNVKELTDPVDNYFRKTSYRIR